MRAHIAPSSCSRSLALRFVRSPLAPDQCCTFSVTAASRSGFSPRRAREEQENINPPPIQRRIQCRSYTTAFSMGKTSSRITPLSKHANFLALRNPHHGGWGRGPEAGLIATGRRAGSGFMETLFGRRSKKYAQRQDTVSSRYLDSGPEDAILGRSLLHKNNGDEFLRCTEFDREGS